MSGGTTSSSGSSASNTMVPNPYHDALQQLYIQLQGDADTMSNALKPASQQMTAGGTWVGPTADSWGSQLDGRARDCATQVANMLADVSSALAAEPAQVTQQVLQQKVQLMKIMERGF